MDRIIGKLLIYGGIQKDSILMQMAGLCRDARGGRGDAEELRARAFAQVRRILQVATDYGFDRNLWQNYLTLLLATTENPFSITCENIGAKEGSVNEFAKSDFAAFIELFHYDFRPLEEAIGTDCFTRLTAYKAIGKPEFLYNRDASEKLRALSDALADAQGPEEFFTVLTDFYGNNGVGIFGLNRAFRMDEDGRGDVRFLPINNMDRVVLDDLVGCAAQKKKLMDNTLAFVEGRPANNCLLFGDSGTGKSTCIKAVVNELYPKGLRMIEIYKHQFRDLNAVISHIKNRNYRFIIYMDDLSFEEFETDYKFLKAVIEGGVETKPANVLIYATSNRRHIVKETWSDRDDVEMDAGIHKSDTMEEKLSLVHRFGVTIGFHRPDRKQFNEIVRVLSRRNGIDMEEEQLLAEAQKWEMAHGGLSGRTAQQFIDHLQGGGA